MPDEPCEMTLHRVPGCRCPHCGNDIDGAAVPAGSPPPQPGDLGVCFHCEGVIEYEGLGQAAAVPDGDPRVSPAEMAGVRMIRARYRAYKIHRAAARGSGGN